MASRFIQKAKTESPVFLICPGFGNDEMDYISPMDKGKEVDLWPV